MKLFVRFVLGYLALSFLIVAMLRREGIELLGEAAIVTYAFGSAVARIAVLLIPLIPAIPFIMGWRALRRTSAFWAMLRRVELTKIDLPWIRRGEAAVTTVSQSWPVLGHPYFLPHQSASRRSVIVASRRCVG